jgi:phosphatidylglycerophosphatase A
VKRTIPILTTFGLGHLRPFPGTWGSVPTVVVAALLVAAGLGPADQPWVFNLVMIAILVVFTLACAVRGDEAEAVFLKKDPSQVVADETAGQALPLLFLPAAAFATPGRAAWTLIFAFIAFRLMDIVKPWPAQQIQRYPGGWGVVLDDLMAGVYAMIVLQIATRWAM